MIPSSEDRQAVIAYRQERAYLSLKEAEYVAGKLNKEDGKLLGQLFRMRKTGDYDDLTDWTSEEIEPLFPKAKLLVDKIASLIK